ncbi:MAG: hypothetical protein K5879_06960 [Lachnospiraceae bacterium]|nr:hypothetical protein [Lachnospiraceae bacterium]
MKKNNAAKIILTGFYILFTLLTGGLFILSIARPQNYLSSARMGIQTVVFAFLFAGVMYLWRRFAPAFLSSPKVFIPLAAVYWIFLYLVCAIHGNAYHVVGDYEILYISALELADGKELSFAHYFMTYGNNAGPMILLAGIFKICHAFRINEFYPTLILTSATVAGSIWAVGELLTGGVLSEKTVTGKNASKETKASLKEMRKVNYRIPVLIFTAFCLPVYVFTGAFYTDTLSFGLGMIAVALIKLSYSKKNAEWLMVLAGFLTVIGGIWKITTLIFLTAVFLTWVLYLLANLKKTGKQSDVVRDMSKQGRTDELLPEIEEKTRNKIPGERTGIVKRIILYAVSIVLFTIFISLIFSFFTIYKDSKQYANPTSAWLALGMRGNGSYAENVEFSDAVNALSTKEEKSAFVKEYIKNHISESFTLEHILSKAQNNFAGGTFTCSDFTANPSGHSILWEMMDPGGRYYYGCSGYAFSYVVMMYLLFAVGGVCAIMRLVKGDSDSEESPGKTGQEEGKGISTVCGLPFFKIAADVSFFGLFVFLMIWESNNRQLYNQLPVMILGLFSGVDFLLESAERMIKKESK